MTNAGNKKNWHEFEHLETKDTESHAGPQSLRINHTDILVSIILLKNFIF